jgi:hypothetical protein
MINHPAVVHPKALLEPAHSGLAKFNEWACDHLAIALGSSLGVWLAFIIPLLAFGISPLLTVLGLVSSYWIQLWALFVLQKSSNKAQSAAELKADVDHAAMTHMATQIDAIVAKLDESA